MRAVAQDQDAAAMMGINVNRTISFTFILAGSLAGAAGLLFLLLFKLGKHQPRWRVGPREELQHRPDFAQRKSAAAYPARRPP